ncbi:chloramphenicol phosphotransferase CPT family protein [Streptomyces sp. NRRL F-5065]|uniref:chloramphenicol phosphotransferase CPT family protein n=1 Tax=Streptomyces sp. NRRL F-5065 TaxID=1463855 RepID=UPI00099CC58E|nr:AAA family ATPase [Streptomyces sp. NRRL F-5065]
MPARADVPPPVAQETRARTEGPAAAGDDDSGGLIIFLNGTSSSGKSSIARELLAVLEEPFFHLPVDAFHAMRTRREADPAELPAILRRTWRGYHRAVAGMAAAGNNVVVDHVLSEDWRLPDCLGLFPPGDVVLVGVRCSLEELERRERARGDRPAGLAARQYGRVHAHGLYDIECDTTTADAAECARRIGAFLPHRPRPTAFERLRATLRPDLPSPAAERGPVSTADRGRVLP